MRATDEAEYREFVVARLSPLRRTAFLLCRDWYTADDLVAVAFDRLYRHWSRRDDVRDLDAYVRGILTRAWLDELRRPWRRATLHDAPLQDVAAIQPDPTDRMTLNEQLARLGPQRRAVIVLRYYCDLSVEQTAEILGISAGTVKSQTARGLETMRNRLSATGEL